MKVYLKWRHWRRKTRVHKDLNSEQVWPVQWRCVQHVVYSRELNSSVKVGLTLNPRSLKETVWKESWGRRSNLKQDIQYLEGVKQTAWHFQLCEHNAATRGRDLESSIWEKQKHAFSTEHNLWPFALTEIVIPHCLKFQYKANSSYSGLQSEISSTEYYSFQDWENYGG